MQRLNFSRENLRKFGVTMGIAFLLIFFIMVLRQKNNSTPILIISVLFFSFGFFAPQFLRPVYIAWMDFAFILGWLNTHIILLILFYLIFAPVGICLRLFRIDLLDRRFEKDKASYWKKKEKAEFRPESYEHQF
jgi:hypothetical protein